MKAKEKRLEVIRSIVNEIDVCSQEDLQAILKKRGIVVTQATLSRDLRKLKVAKVPTADGNYIYKLPENSIVRRVHTPQYVGEMMSTSGFLSLRVSGNIAVVRTTPGHASSIAYHIDSANIPGILGTIAGDDTIFITLDEAEDRGDTVRQLGEIFNRE